MNKYNLILVMGGPASGKGTLCAKLTKKFNHMVHISAGDLVRSQSSIDPEFIELMKKGSLLPASYIGNLITSHITKNIDMNKTILLDGFPRNQSNYEYFTNEMVKFFNLIAILVVECDDDVMVQRTVSRSQSSGRIDDTAETCLKRIKSYYEETTEIIKLFDSNIIRKISGELNDENNETFNAVVKMLSPKDKQYSHFE